MATQIFPLKDVINIKKKLNNTVIWIEKKKKYHIKLYKVYSSLSSLFSSYSLHLPSFFSHFFYKHPYIQLKKNEKINAINTVYCLSYNLSSFPFVPNE